MVLTRLVELTRLMVLTRLVVKVWETASCTAVTHLTVHSSISAPGQHR